MSYFKRSAMPTMVTHTFRFCTRKDLLFSSMGCMYSKRRDKHPGYQESLILASETSFSLNEVEALYVLFKKLSSSIVDDNLITKEEFQLALIGNCRQQNLFVDRVFNVFDLKRKGVIGFEEFVRSLSIFHPRTPYADKIACMKIGYLNQLIFFL